MDEDTTTEQVIPVETGAEEASPVEPEQIQAADVPAVDEPSESDTDSSDSEEQSTDESGVDGKLKKYAASQGIDLDSPSAIKAASLAMKAQSEATKNSRRASELEKTVSVASDLEATTVAEATGQDPELLKRLQRVEVKEAVRDFWNQDGIDKKFEPTMIELLKTKPYLAGDLESLYASAVLKSGGVAAVKSQGGREALTNLAHKQQAAVPAGNATTKGTPKGKDFKELSIKEMEKQLGFAPR